MKKLAIITLCALAAQGALAGIHYQATMRSGRPGAPEREILQVSVWLDGERARVEWSVPGSGAPPLYALTVDGGETCYRVNGGMYVRMDAEDLRAAGRELFTGGGEGGALSIEATELSSEKLLQEPGEPLLDRETTHYRFKSSSVTEIKVLGMKKRSQATTVEDVWTTTSIPNHTFGALVKLPFSPRVAMGDAEGFILKTVTEMTTTGKRGRTGTKRSVVTVDELKEGPISPDRFDLAAVLKLQEMPSMTASPSGKTGANPFAGLLGGRRRSQGGTP